MLEAFGLSFRYDRRSQWLFQDLDLHIAPGEIVGLPGPSGRGKSTLAKILSGYLTADGGIVQVDGRPLPTSGYRPVQLLFQHPELAVNPHWKAEDILTEGWEPSSEFMSDLGIETSWLGRYPHELSGGELQRICLARALGPGTRYLLCDEMSSMLDSITQAGIWRSVLGIARSRELGLLVISHDQTLLAKICDRVMSFFKSSS